MTPEAQPLSIPEQYAQAVIASMAHMTDANLQTWIDRLTEERSQPLYAILVSSYREQKSGDDLWMYRRELERRQAEVRATLQSQSEKAA